MILGLCGSPRAMTTEYVLRAALGILQEKGFKTVFWGIRGKKIGFCIHCDHCLKEVGCIIDDDVQGLYPLLREAEALVIATPVYNGGVSAQIKAVMDRTRALLAQDRDALRDKPGIAIAVWGDRVGGQELALQQIQTYLILNGAIPLSGGFFGANLGASLWSKDSMDGIREDDEGMRSMRKTVNRLMEYMEERA
jgi:multimeric flavodoxin WrbA